MQEHKVLVVDIKDVKEAQEWVELKPTTCQEEKT